MDARLQAATEDKFMSNSKDESTNARRYYTYIIKCSDLTLYTGWTIDLAARIQAHNSGKGAKYTSSRTPVELLASWEAESKSDAMKMEYEIKKLSRSQKLALAART